MRRRLLGALIVALTCGPAQAGDTVQPIRFPAGKSSATMHAGLVRGTADVYAITARQGQTADILVKSLEDNASLQIYKPPAKPVTGQDGPDIDGPVLPAATRPLAWTKAPRATGTARCRTAAPTTSSSAATAATRPTT